jgi:putative peptide zinc metalloprotease protein
MVARAVHPGYDLVLADRTRVPVLGTTTIGRSASSTVRLIGPSVSRRHVRLTVVGDALVVQDAGSRYGTWVDGARVTDPVALHDGARLRLGDEEVVVELRRGENESRRTLVVPVGASAALAVAGAAPGGPRLRSGYAIKRLEAAEGRQRWVLRDLRGDRFLRLGDEGELVELLDGRRTVEELMGEAERRLGQPGPARMIGLLTELADRGLLAGDGEPEPDPAPAKRGWLTPREWTWPGAGERLEVLYARGGWVLFTPVALAVLGAVAVTGILVFAYLTVGRYGTPFVVANRIGLGGVVFVVGRLAVAAVHETAHGLAMAAFGRRAGRAGLKVVLVFPYVFVDTSDAWFEPRRRRIAVSAAGPVSDAVLGATFAWLCLLLGAGALRDVCFQLAFGAYVGALVNLNPFIERDGYHMLADALREPGLRRRARVELQQVLRRQGYASGSTVLRRYALAGLAWSVVAAAGAVVVSLRYAPALRSFLPGPVVWAMLASVWAAALTPALMTLGGPLLDRVRDAGTRRATA